MHTLTAHYGNGCFTEPTSQLVDDYLRPHVVSLSSHIQDTMDLLRALDGISTPEGAWLVAINVKALYNSIPHHHGVRVVENFVSERGLAAGHYNQFVLDLLI